MGRAYFRYIVQDVAAAIHFYREHLGFEVLQHTASGFAELERDGVCLLLNAPGAGGAVGTKLRDGEQPKPGGWNRVQLRVDDLLATYAALRRAGQQFRSDLIQGQGGKHALLEDPSGNLVELFEPRERRAANAGRPALAPFIAVDDVEPLISFLEHAFGAQAERMKSEDGITRQATVRLGDATLMLSRGTDLYGERPVTTHLYVDDVDATYVRALGAGGKSLQAPNDRFYGDRLGAIVDRWDNHWWIATHIVDVDPQTIKRHEAAEFRATYAETD
jgi:uncharacterized glyoxalase superfamily protein PhnB